MLQKSIYKQRVVIDAPLLEVTGKRQNILPYPVEVPDAAGTREGSMQNSRRQGSVMGHGSPK